MRSITFKVSGTIHITEWLHASITVVSVRVYFCEGSVSGYFFSQCASHFKNSYIKMTQLVTQDTVIFIIQNQPVPWCKFFTSLPVLAIWVGAFCRNFMFGLLITEVQQYYKDVYNLPSSMVRTNKSFLKIQSCDIILFQAKYFFHLFHMIYLQI